MIYTKQVKLAMKIAYEAHKGQFDKCGIPYIFHPIHLAEQCTDEKTTIVALLHDVVEDTDYTIEQLRELGFDEEILEAIQLLTHKKGTPYMEYVAAISENKIAKEVKRLDLGHNLDLTRVDEEEREQFEIKMSKKRALYKEALAFLEEKKGI